MIRILILILVAGILLTGPIAEAQGCGDCDDNGVVSLLDSLVAAQSAVGLVSLTGYPALRCDVDGDGSITIMDSLVLAQIVIGLIRPLECAKTWTQRLPSTSPPGRFLAAMAYDANRRVSLLFGGGDLLGAFDDTWEWDGSDWLQRFPATHPSARVDHAMEYDSGRGVTVLFGGVIIPGGKTAETWEWDGLNWTLRFPTVFPPRRSAVGMAYDSRRQVMVMWGGDSSSPAPNIWEWDGVNWQVKIPATPPIMRLGQGMAFNEQSGETILFGGSTHGPVQVFDDTWTWDGVNWEERIPMTRPIGRQTMALVWTPVLQRVLLFGGIGDGATSTLHNDCWTHDGAQWTPLITTGTPSRRGDVAYSFDVDRGVLVIFGGLTVAPLSLGETWELR